MFLRKMSSINNVKRDIKYVLDEIEIDPVHIVKDYFQEGHADAKSADTSLSRARTSK